MRHFLFGLTMLPMVACADDSESAKGVFVPEDGGSNLQVDAGVDASGAATDLGTYTRPDLLPCESSENVCALTCEVLADPSFCWNVARAEASACGSNQNVGMMSADGLSCTSPETVVRFDAPITIDDVPDRENWGIEVSRAGKTCLELDDGSMSLSLKTAAGTVDVSLTLEPEYYRIECPNGGVWEATDQLALLACKDANGFTSLPGISTTTIGDDFQFGLLPGPDSLLWCRF